MKKFYNNIWVSVLIIIAFGLFIYIESSHYSSTQEIQPATQAPAQTLPATGAPSAYTPPSTEPVFCPQDVIMCPDGSYVGRVPPNCDFKSCP